MFKQMTTAIGLLLIAALLAGCGSSALAQGEQTAPLRTLSVIGTGQVYLTPDVANISIGVHTENKNAAEAVALNNTQSQDVIDALREAGIEAEDIQTTNFSIYPQQQYDPQGQLQGVFYVVDNTVYVTLRELSKIGTVLGSVIEAGANTISGIQFDVADKSEALAEARQAAIEDAQSQAEQLARAADVTLGELQSISIVSGAPPSLFEGKGGVVAAEAAVPVSPGQLLITVDANLVFEIR